MMIVRRMITYQRHLLRRNSGCSRNLPELLLSEQAAGIAECEAYNLSIRQLSIDRRKGKSAADSR